MPKPYRSNSPVIRERYSERTDQFPAFYPTDESEWCTTCETETWHAMKRLGDETVMVEGRKVRITMVRMECKVCKPREPRKPK